MLDELQRAKKQKDEESWNRLKAASKAKKQDEWIKTWKGPGYNHERRCNSWSS